LIVTLGIALGLFVHTTAVALGVAVIFQTSQ
jgi:threonine/homoserine/homoserine lactone efflux protein